MPTTTSAGASNGWEAAEAEQTPDAAEPQSEPASQVPAESVGEVRFAWEAEGGPELTGLPDGAIVQPAAVEPGPVEEPSTDGAQTAESATATEQEDGA